MPKRGQPTDPGATVATVAATGAAAVTAATTACCVPVLGPLLVSLLGVSGAVWAAGLSRFSPWLLLGSGTLLGYAWLRTYRKREVDAKACRSRRPLIPVVVLWSGSVLWLFALTVNLLALVPHAAF